MYREKDNPGGIAQGLQPGRKFNPTHVSQCYIQHDEIRPMLFHCGWHCVATIQCGHDFKLAKQQL